MSTPLPPYPPYESCLPANEAYFAGLPTGTVGWVVCAYFEGGSTTGWSTDQLGTLAAGSTQAEVEAAISAAYGNWATTYINGAVGFVNQTEVNGNPIYEYQLQGYVQTAYGPVSTAPPMPILGPTVNWLSGSDVAACCGIDYGSNPDVLDTVAIEAGMALYQISGRQFAGLTTAHVRPMNQACGCSWTSGLGPWFWMPAPYSGGFAWGGGWGWFNDNGNQMGCNGLSRIKLAGYPIRQIRQVKINGEVLDPSCYRLDEWRYLTRMSLPGPPYQQAWWPSCQALDLNDDQPGTFSIDYLWGVPPPPIGVTAAAQLACQLYMSCAGDADDCLLPVGATRVVRQGIEVDRGVLVNFLDPSKPTGLAALDTFIRAYNVSRAKMRSAIYSPDVEQYARPIGNTAGNAECDSLLGSNDFGF